MIFGYVGRDSGQEFDNMTWVRVDLLPTIWDLFVLE